jgi:uncharacterized protein (TIGR01777 family)
MHVFVTGATGFVGRALVQSLLGRGYEVTAWVRDPERALQRLGPAVQLCSTQLCEAALAERLSRVDAVVNLAGESLLGKPWTRGQKRRLWTSRVELTQQLVAACAAASPPPRTFISASAVGYYGDSAARELTEDSPRGPGFLAELCEAWEQAALRARACSARVLLLRIGIVLGADGGALAAMLPAFRLGLGGRLGDGKQYVPFVHLSDLLSMVLQGLTDERFSGPVNCTAPGPVTARELARVLGSVLRRPAFVPVPKLALRLVLGQRAEVVLQSQRALPAQLTRLGFEFQYASLPDALAQCVRRAARVSIRAAHGGDRLPGRRQPSYVLEHHSRLHVPHTQAFAFFCRAQNLGLITPSWMRFELTGEPPIAICEGTEIRYRIGLGPLRLRWRTVIRSWQPPALFVDTQAEGPYALWWHEHHLQADGDSTLMLDRVRYRPPLGWLGRLVHPFLIRPALRAIFAYRGEAIERLFGRSHSPAEPPRHLRTAPAHGE